LIIDNENQNKKIYELIKSYSEGGEFDIVTGYFTIGALVYLARVTNRDISRYRFILGDIVNSEQPHTIDLLNENLNLDNALKLKALAKEAVEFLKQDKVALKTLEPNFCHAKAYIFTSKDDERHNYFISGSSNLTEAGIGLKYKNNIELNIAETGNNNQFKELKSWFEELWQKPQAHTTKIVKDEDNRVYERDFKEYIIDEIKKVFIDYSPKEIYHKILFELFNSELLSEQKDPNLNRKIGRLENSIIYNSLYEFQKRGVLSLIKMLEKYNGAILADAVGLGKTWSALAVIKYYQLQGRETILLCPKKLENNWKQYLKRRDSKFKGDEFDYIIRYHTDLYKDRLEKDDIDFLHLQSDKPKLLVIDESHNLRNANSSRYKFLLEKLIKPNQDIKILLLSATPINNSLKDIKNQFNLIAKGSDSGFLDSLDIRSLNRLFSKAQKEFKEWAKLENKKISHLIERLPSKFINLIDSLTVARTRSMIKGLNFPRKEKPKNIFVTPKDIGDFKSFKELLDALPPKLTAYKPAYYIKEYATEAIHNERLRDRALVKILYILLAKRFESSWKSLYDTILRVKSYHETIYDMAIKYKENKRDTLLKDDSLLKDNNLLIENDEIAEFAIGKREIKLSEIDEYGELDNFIDDLKDDLVSIKRLIDNLERFDREVASERGLESKDTKLSKLMKILKEKEKAKNKKVIIFTTYTDTANYLFNELKKRGFKKLALVDGNTGNYEEILERFAPYTKLFLEKNWDNFNQDYSSWIKYIQENNPKIADILKNQIDILIATDVLSEGQNLQDADMVINYDIHYNPVRVIQRVGRIDRIGSINETIQAINFWPSKDLNDYLSLQQKVEEKMATMKIVGSEIDTNFTDTLKEIAEDNTLESIQTKKMLEKLNISLEDIEDDETNFGFNDLSLEPFREELIDKIKQDSNLKNMPNGVFSGFKKDEKGNDLELIALLKNRENSQYELIHIDKSGKSVLKNQREILEFLSRNRDKKRYLPKAIDDGDKEAIDELKEMIKSWAKPLKSKKSAQILKDIMMGSEKALKRLKQNRSVDKEFNLKNYDLIAWVVVS